MYFITDGHQITKIQTPVRSLSRGRQCRQVVAITSPPPASKKTLFCQKIVYLVTSSADQPSHTWRPATIQNCPTWKSSFESPASKSISENSSRTCGLRTRSVWWFAGSCIKRECQASQRSRSASNCGLSCKLSGKVRSSTRASSSEKVGTGILIHSNKLHSDIFFTSPGRTRRATRTVSKPSVQPETLQTLSKIRRVVDSDSE